MMEALAGSASVAHGLARRAAQGRAALELVNGSSLETDLLEEQAKLWASLWKAKEGRSPNQVQMWVEQQQHVCARPPPLAAIDILRASSSFKARTSVIDGWHPKHMASMSEQCRSSLADVFNEAELCGDFPSTQSQLVVKLLPKPTGGVRPIGLFRGLFRVWSRCRQHLARAWQASRSKDLQQWNMLPGRQIGDACWRAMVRARCLKQQGKHCIEIN